MDNEEFGVLFNLYCPKCKYAKLPEHFDPCNMCLDYPSNFQSHKPIFWEAPDGSEIYIPTEEEMLDNKK